MRGEEGYERILDECVINVGEDQGAKPKKKQRKSKLPVKGSKINAAYASGTTGAQQAAYSKHYAGKDPYASKKQKHEESILEWFDRSVENELQKRRIESTSPKLNLAERSGLGHPLMVQSTASGIDIQASLRGGLETELSEAIDKFAKAEAIVSFEGAVRAAEEAAASAPPELAEEAAVAGAKDYQAELTTVVNQKVPGVRPVEVIGYVGITRPKFPKKT